MAGVEHDATVIDAFEFPAIFTETMIQHRLTEIRVLFAQPLLQLYLRIYNYYAHVLK